MAEPKKAKPKTKAKPKKESFTPNQKLAIKRLAGDYSNATSFAAMGKVLSGLTDAEAKEVEKQGRALITKRNAGKPKPAKPKSGVMHNFKLTKEEESILADLHTTENSEMSARGKQAVRAYYDEKGKLKGLLEHKLVTAAGNLTNKAKDYISEKK